MVVDVGLECMVKGYSEYALAGYPGPSVTGRVESDQQEVLVSMHLGSYVAVTYEAFMPPLFVLAFFASRLANLFVET